MADDNGPRDHTLPHRHEHIDARESDVPIDDADPWNDLWFYSNLMWVLPHQ